MASNPVSRSLYRKTKPCLAIAATADEILPEGTRQFRVYIHSRTNSMVGNLTNLHRHKIFDYFDRMPSAPSHEINFTAA
jgi:hypothetical protein